MHELTQPGVTALKAGNRQEAYKLLSQAVKELPDDAYAWLWLSGAVDNDEERIACLRQVLRIAPDNQAAARGLERLLNRTHLTAPQPVESKTESILLSAQEPDQEIQSQIYTAEESLPSPQNMTVQAQETNRQDKIPPQKQEWAPPINEAAVTRRVFRTRPSMVPALACFWLFFLGTMLLVNQVSLISQMAVYVVVGLGVMLQFVVLYVILRNFRQVYELTDQGLTLRVRGRKTFIPLLDILYFEPRRTSWQKIRNTADLLVDAVVGSELTHLCLRDIPEYQHRINQIRDLAKNME